MQEQQAGRLANFGKSNIGISSGQIQNTFENKGNVANQAGQQIVHGDINISQSV
jgi:hypothetical protein